MVPDRITWPDFSVWGTTHEIMKGLYHLQLPQRVELHVNACWLVSLKVVDDSDWYITYHLANCFWSTVTPRELCDFSSMCFFQGIVCLEFRRDEVKPLCSSCTFHYQIINIKQMFKNTGMCDIGMLTYYRINIINGTNVMPVFFFFFFRRKNLHFPSPH